jgi:alkanesulfonate monooxygenase SsuD/methylene tetrahydromethanopterin reductase-like flavin-dependent oxidoreductase (luciferase family)
MDVPVAMPMRNRSRSLQQWRESEMMRAMPLRIGYLLPTREAIMEGRPAAGPLLALAERAENLGYDSVWVGDSVLARPRHEPITLLAGVAARTRRVKLGTAVLLPALRNPVLLAHQVATLDQVSEGRVILGIGIASDVPNIRAEFLAAGVPFEKRVGTMMEGMRLCKALWSGTPVDWDGRWHVGQGVLGPTPAQPGGPPIWGGGSAPAALERAAKHFDGWFPNGPDAKGWGEQWRKVQAIAREAGRNPGDLEAALYLTLTVDEDAARAERRMDDFLSAYYGQRPDVMKKRQACFSGPAAAAAEWLSGYVREGASYLVLRFAGSAEQHLETFARLRASLTQ